MSVTRKLLSLRPSLNCNKVQNQDIRQLQSSPVNLNLDSTTGLVRPNPERASSLEFMKVFLVSVLGLYIGASVSQKMASFLEENDLFVPEDDDDD